MYESTNLPRYTRREPPEWQDLLEVTHEVVDQYGSDGELTGEAAQRLVGSLIDFVDDEEREAARYYAEGFIMQGMSQQLTDPAVREQTTSEIAQGIIQAATEGSYVGHLTFEEVKLYIPNNVMVRLAGEAADELDDDLHYLADGLAGAYLARVDDILGESPTDGSLRPEIIDSMMAGRTAAVDVGMSAHAGILNMLRRTAKLKDYTDWQPIQDDHLTGLTPRVLTQAASMHIIKFFDDDLFDRLYRVNEDGTAYFHELPPTDDPIFERSGTVFHRRKLGCPAVQVAGLVMQTLEITTDAIRQARDGIEQVRQTQDVVLYDQQQDIETDFIG